MDALLRPVVLPPELIGRRAPCDLFNALGVLLVRADAVIAFSVRHPFRPTRVFCPAKLAARISDVNPIAQLGRIGQALAQIAERLAHSEHVSPGELAGLSHCVQDAWALDVDACLGYARLCKSGRPSICHVVHVSLLAAELAGAHRLEGERIANVVGGALTMNVAKLGLHDEMHACAERPSPEKLAEIRTHPAEGLRLLRHIGKFDKPWLDVVASHHENVDGSGYPCALKGADIALSARIVRVADSFAARLTGRRARAPLHWNIQRTRGTRNIVQHVFGNEQAQLDPPLMTQLVGALGRFPPGSLVRLNSGEVAVVARRVPGEPASPREVLCVKDAQGRALAVPRRRRIGVGQSEIRTYANDEAVRLASYDWQRVWGYGE